MTSFEPEYAGARTSPSVIVTVAAGAVLGVAARYGISLALPVRAAALPAATLLVNLAGSFVIGLVAGGLDRRPSASRLLRPFAITGVLGSFTTYSAFAVETNAAVADRPLLAVVYLVLTLAGGLAAAAAGDRLAGR